MFYFFIHWRRPNKAKDYHAKLFSKMKKFLFLFLHHHFFQIEMIPIDEIRTKEWYEFEGASTYEYAHAEVKPPTKYVLNKKLKKKT
jgi:hypothetical protein